MGACGLQWSVRAARVGGVANGREGITVLLGLIATGV